MIKSNLLQLGDYVYSGLDKQPCFVASLNKRFVLLDKNDNKGYYFESDQEHLEGIPITEELLKGMGFEHTATEMYLMRVGELEHISILFNKENLTLNISNNIIGTIMFYNKTEYLHELQQAVRLVTKKELTIEL